MFNQIVLILMSFVFSVYNVFANQKLPDDNAFDSSVVLVSLKQNHTISLFQKKDFKGDVVSVSQLFFKHKDSKLSRIYKITLNINADYRKVLDKIIETQLFEYAEFNPIYKNFVVPNDIHANQWHLSSIKAQQAWNISLGNPNIKLAIVDDAVDYLHEDLKDIIFKNINEIPNNGKDDDGNGFIDDVYGANAMYKRGSANPPFTNRSNFSHGTHCAGIAAATTNNGKGIASIGFGITILPVSCADSTRPGLIIAGYEGIVYAADMGADVISLSWGGSWFSSTGQIVIDYANSKGIVVVAAAGNSNVNIKMYPAGYNHVISVAATDQNDKKAKFSNYGSWIDISAPGVDIWSTVTGGSKKYDYKSGTSMACPMVAGLCGLMRTLNSQMNPDEIEKCLKNNADNINANNPNYTNILGGGRINAQKTLQCIKTLFADFKLNKTEVCKGQAIQFTNTSSISATTYEWTISGANNLKSTLKNPNLTFNNLGKYNVKLVVSDGANKDSLIINNAFEVYEPKATMETQISKVRIGEAVFLKIDLVGEFPWNLSITDGTQTTNHTNIVNNPFYIDIYPTKDAVYEINSFGDKNCNGPFSGSATITIDTSKKVQTSNCSNFELFTKTYNFGGNEVPHTIYALKDGNIAVVGITDRGGIGGDDIFLTKLKPNGAVIWTKYYGTSANENGYPLGVFDDDGFNMYIYGTSVLNGAMTGLLIKLDSFGSVLFSKLNQSGAAPDHKRFGLQLSDGNLAICGTSGAVNGQAAFIYSIDKAGNKNWTKSFDLSSYTEHFLTIRELKSKLYTVGSGSNGAGGYGSFITKMNLNGNIIWQKYLDFNYWDAALFLEVLNNKTLVQAYWMSSNGSSAFGDKDIGVSNVDTNGNVIWSKVIGNAGFDEIGGLLTIKNDIYLYGSTKSFDNGVSKLFVIKMDANGNIVWSKIYGKNGEELNREAFTNGITSVLNNQIVFIGNKRNTNNDIILFKIDECGNSNCTYKDVVFNIRTEFLASKNSNMTDVTYLGNSNSAKNVKTNSNNIVTNICPPTIPKCNLKANFSFKETCLIDSVVFNQQSVDLLGKKIINHKWIFHDGSVVVGKGSIKYKFDNLGTFKTTLISFSDTPNQCSDTVVKFITLRNNLYGKIAINRIKHCKGDTIQAKIAATCGTPPFSVSWSPKQYITNANGFSPIVKFPSSEYLVATITDAQNNVFKDSVLISVDNGCCKYESKLYTSKENYCIGDTLNILNLSRPFTANSKWVIFYDGMAIDSMNINELNDFLPNAAGLYTFKLIQSGSCISNVSEISIFVSPLPLAFAGRDSTLCDTSSFYIGQAPLAQMEYNWLPTSGLSSNMVANPKVSIRKPITYYFKVKDLQTQCSNNDSVFFDVAKDSLLLGPDMYLCDGSQLILTGGKDIVGTKFLWSNGKKTPQITIKKTGTYWMQKTNRCGVYMDSVVVFWKECFCTLTLPNAFSPDANAINDYFPEKQIDTIINMQIFNRWGEMIYDNKATNLGWDGSYNNEIVQEGVYLYLIKYRDCFGIMRYLKGTFTLLR